MSTIKDHTGRVHVQRVDSKQWLVAPIDAWGKVSPEWTDYIEFSFGFSKSEAQEQNNRLMWNPHKIRTIAVTRRKQHDTRT